VPRAASDAAFPLPSPARRHDGRSSLRSSRSRPLVRPNTPRVRPSAAGRCPRPSRPHLRGAARRLQGRHSPQL